MNQLLGKRSPIILMGIIYLICNLLLRLILLFHPITKADFSWIEVLKSLALGLISDLFVFVIISVFLWLYLLFLSNQKYNKPWGYILFGLFLTLLIYLIFCNTILNEYGGSLPEIGIAFVALKTILFGLLLFFKRWRSKIRFALFYSTILLYSIILIQNAVSEYFFWNEFGVRYNFIAVDYLVYTNTVIGNIVESYPVIPLFIAEGILAFLITNFIVKKSKIYLVQLPSLADKLKSSLIYSVSFLIAIVALPKLALLENSTNVFANELQSNGVYRFYLAFQNNELDYNQFYKTIPQPLAFQILKQQIPTIQANSTFQKIENDGVELRKNVVLITVESLSAEFLGEYGNNQQITPFLDSLATKSLQFSNLYAVGNRTVRGLEAVTLCMPPTAGESIIKRKDNKNKFSTGSIFRQKGYEVGFLYGGDAYFDNMGDFFGGNGYKVIDKKSFTPEEVSFSNVWGVCDEDMAKKAIQLMNKEAQKGIPFFNHWMTVSNHRPYTYPEGKISISPQKKWREGGVMYTDYALKQFFAMAQKQSWFSNTVFVIVADHCASSSGKTTLPVEGYRIPALIYSPGFISPGINTTLVSQIDLMPTVFGLLHFDYPSKFIGQNVLQSDYKPRAFIATYQDLGFIRDHVLTVISPNRKVKQFDLKLKPVKGLSNDFDIYYSQKPLPHLKEDLVNQTIAYYQTTAHMLKNKKFQNNIVN